MDHGWLLDHSQLRVRLGSRFSTPAIHLYPSVGAEVVLSATATLHSVTGPPLKDPPQAWVSRSNDRAFPHLADVAGEHLDLEEMLEFIFIAPSFADLAVRITLGAHGATPIGTAWLLPVHRLPTQNTALLPLTGLAGELAGHLHVEYLSIDPVPSHLRTPDFESLERAHGIDWLHTEPKVMGHRGMGCTHISPGSAKLPAPITENTIASFAQAQARGADFVEFDVHVTIDGTPIIYHNFEVLTLGRNHTADSTTPVLLEVKDLTLQQLQALDLRSPAQLAGGPFVPPTNPTDAMQREFSALADALQQLPSSLGFDVEIKYPLLLEGGNSYEKGVQPPPDRNAFVDVILHTLFKHAGERPIFITSFDADVCLMLRAKQKRFPVAFLTCGGVSSHERYEDVRCRSLPAAIAFASSQGLLGLATDSAALPENMGEFMTHIHSLGLVALTW